MCATPSPQQTIKISHLHEHVGIEILYVGLPTRRILHATSLYYIFLYFSCFFIILYLKITRQIGDGSII